jgi:hypothetical protein
MIKINVFIINQVGEKPWLKLSMPRIPKVGDEFEMEKGKLYSVHQVWFKPNKNGSCSVNVSLNDPGDIEPAHIEIPKR